MEAAERHDGWLAACDERQVYVVVNREFVAALASVFDSGDAVLEVGAGGGELALALAEHGARVLATDPSPRAGHVVKMSAAEALRQLAPRSVLAVFPPVDAGIEARILAAPSVERLVYIAPHWNGRVGIDAIWNRAAWTVSALPEVEQYLISRLDYLADFTRATRRRRAGALCLKRI